MRQVTGEAGRVWQAAYSTTSGEQENSSLLTLHRADEAFPTPRRPGYGLLFTRCEVSMLRKRVQSLLLISGLAALMAFSWISTAFNQVEGDGDGFDGDELGLLIVIGAGALAFLGWN